MSGNVHAAGLAVGIALAIAGAPSGAAAQLVPGDHERSIVFSAPDQPTLSR